MRALSVLCPRPAADIGFGLTKPARFCLSFLFVIATMPKPVITNATIAATARAQVQDESGEVQTMHIAGEYPLTLYVDRRELITLMTLGQMPEALVIGWLRNQRLLHGIDDIEAVSVDWQVNAAAVVMRKGAEINALPQQRTVTSGCGQGSVFGDFLAGMDDIKLRRTSPLMAESLFDLLAKVRTAETVYKTAGAVHACLLAKHNANGNADILVFVEDVGRHNAVDSIAGWMWLNDIVGDDKIFYTTGRMTSEMVVKCARMGIPYLASRSGCTKMGLEIAHQTGITMIGRAINRKCKLFSSPQNFTPAR